MLAAAGSPAEGERGPADPWMIVDTSDPIRTIVGWIAARALNRTPLFAEPGRAKAELPDPPVAAEPLLAVVTSGSSGRPRVVVRTEESWAASAAAFSEVTELGPDDVLWAPGPVWSTLTLHAIWHALSTGVPVVAGAVAGRGRSDAGPIDAGPIDAGPIDTVTVLHAVPSVVDAVLAAPAGPRLRQAITGGAHSPSGLRERSTRAGVRLLEYYGAAELSFVGYTTGGAGLAPFPGVRIALRDEPAVPYESADTGIGRTLWVNSPYLSMGYLSGSGGQYRTDGRGWATVGDRATEVDGPPAAGRFAVLGRDER